MSLFRTWIVALPVVALAIVGCGGGGESDPSESAAAGSEETSALTKEELIEQSDAICAKVSAAIGAIEPGSPGATAHVADLYTGMVKSLQDLGNPQETEAIYGEYLRTLGELGTAENALKRRVERGSSGLEAAELGADGALDAFHIHAIEYGFKECGKGTSTTTSSGA